MWRARSDGDDRPLHNDDNRFGAGGDSETGSADERGSEDPRSEPTGRKIRRIESGPPGSGAGRDRSGQRPGPSLARRQPGLSAAAGRAAARAAGDRSEPGNGQFARPGRQLGRPETASSADGGVFGGAPGGLPPLRQPTGELPVVPSVDDDLPSSTADAESDATAVVSGSDDLNDWPTDLPATGLFEATAAEASAPVSPESDALGDSLADLDGPTDRSIDATMPSAFSVGGSAGAADRAGRNGIGAAIDALADDARSTATEAAGSMPSAFPDTDGFPGASSFPSWTAASESTSSTVDETLAMGPMAGGRGARSTARPGGPGPSDRRPTQGAGGATRSGSRSAGSQRLQETEIKLAGRQSPPPKPREPNRILLGLALALVVLAGAAVAWWLTREDDPNQVAQEDQEQGADTSTTLATDEAAAPVTEAPVSDDPVLDVPTLSLIGVEPGPLDSATTYSLDLFGEPPGSLLQVVVDDVPQGQPDAGLPDLILPAGRHTLVVNVTDAGGLRTSSPVEVYVLDSPPAAGHIANLASIDIVNEGWDEAVRRFDEYREAGHQDLRLLPITPGFWNIFVPELGDAAGATSYCESFSLAVPDECFPRSFDPATYEGPAPAAPAGDTDDGSTTDPDDGSMTDDGETGSSTSTTTGG